MNLGDNHQIVKHLEAYQNLLRKREKQGDLSSWHYTQFQALAKRINEKTGVSISYMTLLRIFQKKDFKRSPQLATLNALARYLDFADWQAFCQKPKLKSAKSPEEIQSSETASPAANTKKRISFFVSLLSGLLIVASLAFLSQDLLAKEDLPQVSLISLDERPVIPQVLLFKYSVPSDGYQFFFQPASHTPSLMYPGRKSRTFNRNLNPKDSILTLNINGAMFPGSYKAKIIKEDAVYEETLVNIETKDWINVTQFTYLDKSNIKSQPVFTIPIKSPDGSLEASPDVNNMIHENYLEKRYEVNYLLAKDFQLDANELQFEARFKNTAEERILECKYMRISLLTTNGMIEIPLVEKGCKNELQLWASDANFSYKNRDMQLYESEYSDWEKIRITSKDKLVQVFYKDQLIDEISYQEPLGKLTCIRFKFDGNGILDYVKLEDAVGNLKYNNNFEF